LTRTGIEISNGSNIRCFAIENSKRTFHDFADNGNYFRLPSFLDDSVFEKILNANEIIDKFTHAFNQNDSS
jgi:hypothetical protein